MKKIILSYNKKGKWIGFETKEIMTQKEFKEKYPNYKLSNIK